MNYGFRLSLDRIRGNVGRHNCHDVGPGGRPARQTARETRVLVTISKETTYITEPLRADGYPDYVAALNQRFSRV